MNLQFGTLTAIQKKDVKYEDHFELAQIGKCDKVVYAVIYVHISVYFSYDSTHFQQ